MAAALNRPHTRRAVTSSVFLATFVGSVLTVVASSWLLPCPARASGRAVVLQEEGKYFKPRHQGQISALSGRKGWIQVEEDRQ